MASGTESQSEHHVRRELKIDGLHSLTWSCTLCSQEQMCSFVRWWLLTALCTGTEGWCALETMSVQSRVHQSALGVVTNLPIRQQTLYTSGLRVNRAEWADPTAAQLSLLPLASLPVLLPGLPSQQATDWPSETNKKHKLSGPIKLLPTTFPAKRQEKKLHNVAESHNERDGWKSLPVRSSAWANPSNLNILLVLMKP